jgi:hypothetical protein
MLLQRGRLWLYLHMTMLEWRLETNALAYLLAVSVKKKIFCKIEPIINVIILFSMSLLLLPNKLECLYMSGLFSKFQYLRQSLCESIAFHLCP